LLCLYLNMFSHFVAQVHFLYQYSLQFFLEIFHAVLASPKLEGQKEYATRLHTITQELFLVQPTGLLLSICDSKWSRVSDTW